MSEQITFTDVENMEEKYFCKINGGHNFRHIGTVCEAFKRSLPVGS